jgi:octaprenyl-diphosphate synthase
LAAGLWPGFKLDILKIVKISANHWTSASDLLRLVEPELKEVEVRLKSEAVSGLPIVDEMNRYLHESGGKRLRPGLLLLAAKLFGAPTQVAVQLGVVVELIHVATLVHDDIIDNSDVRRGRESLNARWGNELTVLFGDWLYMTAFWLALEQRNFRILDILIRITRTMVEGELLQLQRNHRLDITEEEHLRINWHKTAHLFAGCCRLGGMLGKAPSELEEKFAEYGEALGMAFQIVDDMLDYSSNQQVIGKPVLKDLPEGNVTLPIINLLRRASPQDVDFIQNVVQNRDFSAENKSRILVLVQRYNTLEDSLNAAMGFARNARAALKHLPPSPYRDALRALPDLLINRLK